MPIYLHYNENVTWVNESGARWLDRGTSKEELLAIGKKTFNTSFLDVFPISATNGGVKGVAFISLYKTQFSGKQSHKLYLKRMFMSEDDCHLLPKWAFFIRCILNADGLDATASRESLVYNDTLKEAKKEISDSIKSYLKTIDMVDPDIYQRLISTYYLHLKAIAAEDHELLLVFMDDLLFETNKGPKSYRSIRHLEQTIYYTPNVNDFKQIHRIAGSQGILVINAGYTFEEELLKKISQLHPELKIKQISPESLLNTFHSVDVQNSAELVDFENRAAVVLQPLNCSCSLKHFNPIDTPAIYIGAYEDIDAKSTQGSSAFNPLEATLGMFTKKTKVIEPLLCFNVDNKLVKSIIGIKDPYLFPSIIHILYVQALMLGKYPVSDREMNLFNEALHNLVIMGMENFINL